MLEKILVKRGYLLDNGEHSSQAPYFAAKLLNQFGVEVDKPALLSKANVKVIADFFGKNIPNGFYANPQDTKYFTCEELLIEKLVSYFVIENVEGVNSKNENAFDRIELFKKALPNYKDGDEVVLRKYKVIASPDEILEQIVEDYCNYTRQWSNDEFTEIKWLFMNGYYKDQHIKCKDNAISLFLEYKNSKFAKMLDKKDVVKLSIELKGEYKEFSYTDDEKMLLKLAIQNAYDCPLSKKQAKYFNTIARKVKAKLKRETNKQSPYRLAKIKLKNGDILGAASILAQNGALLERNLVWLLSRASFDDLKSIIDMIKTDNPIVLYQLLQGITKDDYNNPRIFKFYAKRTLKNHIETSYEFKYRKSKLSLGVKDALNSLIKQKIKDAYTCMPKLGKIYINDEFKNIALPINTSASGSGLDVLPIGSRLKITDDYIRVFCYWNNAFDIDTSAIMLKDVNSPINPTDILYWGSDYAKKFGDSALTSGDDRSANGAEYQDFKISELLEKGYKYVIYTLNGYGAILNEGTIYCGYQNKKDLDTKAWSAKNIATKIQVKGNTRQYMGFAIDLENKEMIILNQILDGDNRVIRPETVNAIKDYLSRTYLSTFNMFDLLSCRGEVVDNAEDADMVFDRNYIGNENQQVVKPFQVEKLVSLLKN